MTLVDATRQWFNARVGVGPFETSRADSLCVRCIESDDILVVEDLALDERFADNPLLHGGRPLRFYAGAPLVARSGAKVGALCVLDVRPRTLSTQQLTLLRDLAAVGVAQLEARRHAPADGATYAANTRGRSFGFPAGSQAHVDGLTSLCVEAEVAHAFEEREFELHYQPQVLLASGESVAVEALLRWNHPRLGLLSPARFLPAAEESGVIVSLGAWVLHEACGFARRWADAGGPGVVSVNISPRQFEDHDFIASVADALAVSRLEPERLWLEIKESLIHRAPESAAITLAELRRLGVRSSIDDFGSGYSSLNYLKHFPIGGLKIDRTFLAEVGRPDAAPGDEAIVGAILAVGRALRLEVVAEGIETPAQREFLRARGCEFGQGYFFDRPLRESDLIP